MWDWWLRRAWSSPTRRSVTAAVGASLLLRLLWVAWQTHTPSTFFSDNAQFLLVARGLIEGRSPSVGEHASAFFSPGYPILLGPLALVERATGAGIPATAAVLNAVLGAVTVLGVAVLARQWFSRRAAVIAAWIAVFLPAQILLTSALLSETAFAAMAVWITAGITDLVRRRVTAVAPWLAMGAAVGAAVLVRNVAIVLLSIPLLIPQWRVSRRCAAVLLLVCGMALPLGPWAVRNGVQVGVWTPFLTGGASSFCLSYGDGATGSTDAPPELYDSCFVRSPWADRSLYLREDSPRPPLPPGLPPVDEARWFRETTSQTIDWIRSHPADALRLTARKPGEILGSSSDTLTAAEDFGRQPMSATPRSWLLRWSDWTFRTILVVSALGLLLLPAARRATPLWGVPLLILLVTLPGVAMDRYNHPMQPFLAALVGGVAASIDTRRLVSMMRSATAGLWPRSIWADRSSPPVEQNAFASLEERRWRPDAAALRWRVAVVLAAVAAAAMVGAVSFDLAGRRTVEPCTDFTSPSRSLLGIAFVTLALSSLLLVADRHRIGRHQRAAASIALPLILLAWWTSAGDTGCPSGVAVPDLAGALGAAAAVFASVGLGRGAGVVGRAGSTRMLNAAVGFSVLAASLDSVSRGFVLPAGIPRTAFWVLVMAGIGQVLSLIVSGSTRSGRSSLGLPWLVLGLLLTLISLAARVGSDYTYPVGGTVLLTSVLASLCVLAGWVMSTEFRSSHDPGAAGGPVASASGSRVLDS